MPSLTRMIVFFLVVSTILGLVEWLSFRLMQRVYDESKWWWNIKLIWLTVVVLIWMAFFVNAFMWPTWRVTHPKLLSVLSISFFVLFVPKLFLSVFEIAEMVREGALLAAQKLKWTHRPVSRASFLSTLGLGVSGLTFASFLYGVTWGKYAYRTERLRISIPKLPKEFQGFRIVQISDAHLGSFTNTPEPVLEALRSIASLKPDVILFTGDLVNTHADEAEPWIAAFKELDAPFGKFSIMGNHDYADYGPFEDHERVASRRRLHEIHHEMGFRLLLNEHEVLQKGGDRLTIVGVENWGRGFRQSGDLQKALDGSPASVTPTILMSHDPTHWEEQVMNNRAPIELTLSGHTHGMQFGIEIPWLGIKWSPSQWRYKRWAGLYEENGQFLHVNRGFGVLGFHGRVGMPPEITVLELQQA